MKKSYLKYSVTPEVNTQLKTVAQHLPPIQRINEQGKPLFKQHSKYISWDELSAEDKKKFPEKQYYPKGYFKADLPDARRERPLLFRWETPQMIDHFTEMYWIFREHGDAGVVKYVDEINAITEASKKAAESLAETNTDGKV